MVVVAHDDERRSDLAAKKAHSSHGHNEFHGHYGPAASGLRWVPCAAAVSVVRGMLCASHNDLRLHVQLFSRALSSMFFFAGAGAGLPEGGVFVCADVPPLGPALQDVQRAVESLSRFRGYSPVPAVAAASALRWIPHAAVVSTVRALLGSSHDDLRLRVHQLSRSLSDAFFVVGAAAAPFASGERFPEGCRPSRPLNGP
ncbi:hypothetical protein E2562_008225 [Oryza meyeriana var. granulata]|uniref:Uncharacterized protein n=1 Tax=Oryza meyeriana var. granulata TaxID=110450 RepID=A0A6G1DFY3_9ORYZ|nr:hypothetical protein E2562_008225 [Oryza meyeriana var. granulata]